METNISRGSEGINVAKLMGVQECGNCRKWHTAQCEDRKQCYKTDPSAASWCPMWRRKS